MSFLPKINFVEVLPNVPDEEKIQYNKIHVFCGCYDPYSNEIYVLKSFRQILTLGHELTHWMIQKTFFLSPTIRDSLHRLYDACPRYSFAKLGKWEKVQIATRVKRWSHKKRPIGIRGVGTLDKTELYNGILFWIVCSFGSDYHN